MIKDNLINYSNLFANEANIKVFFDSENQEFILFDDFDNELCTVKYRGLESINTLVNALLDLQINMLSM
jgi:hypothetical protein